jgi:predicted DNA-binding transcriptional regulator YafY
MYKIPNSQHPSGTMKQIIQGAQELHCVAIRYRDQSQEVTERIVEPYEIKNGKLFAYCQTKEGIRGFTLINILAAVETNTSYVPRFPVLIT